MAGTDVVRGSTWLLCTVFALGAAHAAEQVVLQSSSASYAPGLELDSASVIALAEREFIVFVTEDGRSIRIAGPYTGPASGADGTSTPESDSNVRRALAQLFGLQPAEAEGLAGVRGGQDDAEGSDTRTDPWLLHAERTGDQCVLRGSAVQLWREQVGDGASAELVDVRDGRVATVRWAEGDTQADWPFAGDPVDGGVYLVRPAGELRSVAIRLHALPQSLGRDGLATVAWLATRGCIEQARLLLRDEPPAP